MTAATRQPVLYLSHGAPPLADDRDVDRASSPRGPATCRARRASSWSPRTGRRRRSRCRPPRRCPLVYDFWGFPQHYYDVTYDAPGAPRARRPTSAALCAAPGRPVHQDQSRGLDHGAYVPLVEMFPEADVPVLQMSMPTLDPRAAVRDRPQARAAARRGHADRRVRVHHPQPALVQPGDAGRRAAARLVGGVRRLGRARRCARRDVDALLDFLHRAPAARVRRTRAPSTSRRCSSRSGAAYGADGARLDRRPASSTASGTACPSAPGSSPSTPSSPETDESAPRGPVRRDRVTAPGRQRTSSPSATSSRITGSACARTAAGSRPSSPAMAVERLARGQLAVADADERRSHRVQPDDAPSPPPCRSRMTLGSGAPGRPCRSSVTSGAHAPRDVEHVLVVVLGQPGAGPQPGERRSAPSAPPPAR